MYFEQYGNETNPILVFLHGAFFVHSFGRQYPLADDYFLVVPHLMGYGREARRAFDAEAVTEELAEFIAGFNRKVTLVGFSLGAQLAAKLVSEREELFNGAVLISPWLIKKEPALSEALRENAKQLKTMKNRFLCGLIGLLNGLPGPQRKEFVEQMQLVSEETLKNSLYNGISLETLDGFSGLSIPVLALAGEKESPEVLESVSRLGELNPHCRAEVWPRAKHNIPPMFHKRLNARLREFAEEAGRGEAR